MTENSDQNQNVVEPENVEATFLPMWDKVSLGLEARIKLTLEEMIISALLPPSLSDIKEIVEDMSGETFDNGAIATTVSDLISDGLIERQDVFFIDDSGLIDFDLGPRVGFALARLVAERPSSEKEPSSK